MADRFIVAQQDIQAGATAGALRLLRELKPVDQRAPDQWFVTRAQVLEVLLASALQRPDAPRLIARLDADVVQHAIDYPHMTNLILTRLHEQAGDFAAALRATRRAEWYFTPEYLSMALHEEGRLAVLTGDTTSAIRAWRRYLALRDDPERGVLPEVEQVRSALQQMERRDR